MWFVKSMQKSLWGTQFRISTDRKSLEHFAKVSDTTASLSRSSRRTHSHWSTARVPLRTAVPIACRACRFRHGARSLSGNSRLTPVDDEDSRAST